MKYIAIMLVAAGIGFIEGRRTGAIEVQNQALANGAGHDDPETGRWVWTGSGRHAELESR